MTDKPRAIQLLDIASLVPYAENAKKHSDVDTKKLATAIKTYGWTQPIIVDADLVIIAGHGRRLAALSLGMKKVPVIVRDDLTKAQADALRLADNRVTSTEYDMSAIQAELMRLSTEDVDLSTLGFDEKELDFAVEDLGEMNDDFFVEEIGDALEEQKSDNAGKIEAIEDTAAPVGDALGFKRVTIAQSRELRGLMGQIEVKTGKTGPEALIDVLKSAVI